MASEDKGGEAFAAGGVERLGRYLLVGRLGFGGMAQIYLARAVGPGGFEKQVVVKRLHAHLADDPVLVRMFLDEARIAAHLNHPNIVQTFDVGTDSASYYMVMEYVPGRNVTEVVEQANTRDRYPAPEFWAALWVHLLDALHHAHSLMDLRERPVHFVHRDVSPPNIVISYDGTPKLLDFGIAKAAERSVETMPGAFKGRYEYMSPEQCLAEELDARSDIFSAAIVLWELCTGKRLFKERTELGVVHRVLTCDVHPPHLVNRMVHPRLSQTIFRALQRRPEHRWASAAEFRDAIESDLGSIHYHLRKTEIADFMHDIFGDVIARQRHTIGAMFRGDPEPGDRLAEIPSAPGFQMAKTELDESQFMDDELTELTTRDDPNDLETDPLGVSDSGPIPEAPDDDDERTETWQGPGDYPDDN